MKFFPILKKDNFTMTTGRRELKMEGHLVAQDLEGCLICLEEEAGSKVVLAKEKQNLLKWKLLLKRFSMEL